MFSKASNELLLMFSIAATISLSGVSVGVGSGARVGVAVGSGVGLLVGAGAVVAVGSGVGLLVGAGAVVAVGSGVGVLVGAGVGVAVGSGVGLLVGAGAVVAVGSAVGVGDEKVPTTGVPLISGGSSFVHQQADAPATNTTTTQTTTQFIIGPHILAIKKRTALSASPSTAKARKPGVAGAGFGPGSRAATRLNICRPCRCVPLACRDLQRPPVRHRHSLVTLLQPSGAACPIPDSR